MEASSRNEKILAATTHLVMSMFRQMSRRNCLLSKSKKLRFLSLFDRFIDLVDTVRRNCRDRSPW